MLCHIAGQKMAMRKLICFVVLAGLLTARVAGAVIISEIHYHPVEEAVFNSDGTPALDLSEDVHEFIEIQNTGSTALQLSGWKVTGGIGYSFPTNAVIEAGAFRVVAKNPERLAAVYSLDASIILGPYSGHLGN